jgi:hypothetical protein
MCWGHVLYWLKLVITLDPAFSSVDHSFTFKPGFGFIIMDCDLLLADTSKRMVQFVFLSSFQGRLGVFDAAVIAAIMSSLDFDVVAIVDGPDEFVGDILPRLQWTVGLGCHGSHVLEV